MQSPHSDHDLISAMRQGSEQALSALLERYRDGVYAKAMAIVNDPQEALDVVQDVFVTLWENRKNIEVLNLGNDSPSTIRLYLYTLARNKSINIVSRQKRFKEIKAQYAYLLETTEYQRFKEADPRGLLLRRAISQMRNGRLRDAAELVYLQETDPKEVAMMMGVDSLSVVRYLTRAKTYLKDWLEKNVRSKGVF